MNEIADHGVRFGRIAAMLPVKDMGKAYDFYVNVLGFQKTFENGNPVGFMILKRAAGELHLTLQKNHKAADFNVAHLLVDDVDALHARCKQSGMGSSRAFKTRIMACAHSCSKTPMGTASMLGK